MKKSLDISLAFSHFFQLKDWYIRVLFFGGIPLLGLLITYLVNFLSDLIPSQYGIGLFIYCFGYLIYFALYLLFEIYMLGYKIEVAEAVFHNNKIADVKTWANPETRLKNGVKLGSAQLLYILPVIVPLIAIFFFVLVMLLATGIGCSSMKELNAVYRASCTGNSSIGIGILLLVCFGIVVFLLSLFMTYAVLPAQFVNFLHRKSFGDAVSPRKIWILIQKNALNLFVIFLLILGIGIALVALLLVSELLILCCIGIIVFPVVYAVGPVFMLHFEAHLLGQLAKIDKES